MRSMDLRWGWVRDLAVRCGEGMGKGREVGRHQSIALLFRGSQLQITQSVNLLTRRPGDGKERGVCVFAPNE